MSTRSLRPSARFLLLAVPLLMLASCATASTSDPDVTPTTIATSLSETLGVACDPPNEVSTLELRINEAGHLSLRIEGLEPEDRPLILYRVITGEEQAQGELESSRGVGPSGKLNEQIKMQDVGLSEQQQEITWDIAVVHTNGVLCETVSSP